jgi:chorismate mutase
MVATKAFLLAVIALFSWSASADQSVDRLFELINERLGYMEDVALYKARHQLPIEDPPREQKVVAAAQRQAASLELDAASVQDFCRG